MKTTPLADHKYNWETCGRCPLCDTRTKIVLFKGEVPCDVLLVGEAPGPSEDIIGFPFMGPAGHLLDDMLKAAGWNLVDQDIMPIKRAYTNLTACIPLDEGGDKFTEPPKGSIAACSPRVIEFFKLCKPKAVVMVGSLSEKHVPTILKGICKGVHFVSIVHPAAIMRMESVRRPLAIKRAIVTLRNVVTLPEFQKEPSYASRPTKKKSSRKEG